MSAPNKHPNRATLLLSIVITLGLVAVTLPMAETNLLSHETRSQPVIVPQTSPTGTYFDHLVFIIMENAGITDICGSNLPPPCSGSNTPYMSSLANSYGIETQYVDLAGSSQPNYIGIMAATLNGCGSGCGPNSLTELNLVDRFEGAGLAWKAYMENQTPITGCDNSDHGFYEFIHNPFVSFHDIDTNATRCNKIVLANPANNSTCTGADCALINDLNSSSAPNFMWLTPNDCNNMHGNTACSNGCHTSYTSACNKAGDNYLSGLVPNILNSNTFQTTRAALFITFDEGNGFCPSPNASGADCMYTVWAGPTTKTNFSSNHADTHYFFTKTIETNWGLATMTSNDAGATAMTEFFSAPSPDFSISATSPAPVNAGQSATSTVTVSALNGFSGTVSLTDTIPSGLSCGSISPNSIVGSGTAAVSCSATNAANYTLTITGTSGSLVHTAIGLFQFRDFTVAASSVTVNAGVSGTSTVTVTAVNRFAGTVTLTDTVPSGLVCGSITPGSLAGSGTASVSCSTAISGNYTLTITGTSGSLVHTATPIFHVQDFGIAASSPAPVSVGSSVISTISISSINHFTGVVSLTDTVPSGLTCGTISPSSITGSGTATVSCSATIAGNYTLTLTGTSGSLVHTAVALFQYRDFTISATTPGPVDSTQSATSTITVTALNHFNDLVNLTETVPVGLTCGSVTPSSVAGSGTATVSCSASVAGNYTLTITGSSGSLLHSTTVVLRFRDFTITATSPVPVNAGQSPTSTVTVVAVNGFAGTVTFSITAPPGLTCGSFSPSSIIASGSASVSCSATVAGNYTATITGTSTPLIHNATATFQFRDFTMAATSPARLNAGSSAISTITVVALNHFSGSVSLADTVPAGLSCGTITPNSVTGFGSATVSCNATAAGNYTLTITGSSGTLVHTALAVFQFQDFTMSASSPAPANAASSATSTITVAAVNGFAGGVTFSDSMPSGLTCGAITPASVTGSGTATVSCSATVAGNYSLTVTGTSGILVHSAIALFQFRDFTMTATSLVAANVGASSISTVTVSALNHFSGSVLFSDTVPAGLTCGVISPGSVTGSGTATVSCGASLAGNYTLTLTGTSGQLVHSTTTLFQFWDFSSSASSPAPLNAGSSATSTITITSANHFNGIVSLTDTASSGLVCGAITPTSITGSGTATVSCNASIAANYTLIITGTSGSLVHTTTVLFQFRDFTIAASTVTVNVNNSGSSIITIAAVNKFAGVVTLTDNIPTGLVCRSITPGTVTGSGTATISCTASVAGNYTLTITGTSGSLVHTAIPIFQVQDFGIVASSPAPVNAGSSATSTITISAINHFAGIVNLTYTVPSGLTCGAITPASLTGSGIATVSCAATVAGNYTLTLSGSSGSLVHTTTALFQYRDFTIAATSPGPVNAGSSALATVTVTSLDNFGGIVSLTDTVPSGLACGSITPSSVTGSGTASVSCSASVAGNYTLTITGSSGSLLHSATVVLRFQDFTVTATSPTAVNAGQSSASTVTVVAVNGFAGTVTFTITPPPGLTCGSFNPTSIIASGSTTVSCSATVAGNYTATITGTSTSLIHNATALFQFRDFTITSASPAPVNASGPASSTITLAAVNHFSGSISLTDTVPSGLACGSITSGSLAGSGTATVSCSATVAGNYTLTITGTSGSLSHSTTATFRFQDYDINANPVSITVNAGTAAPSTVTVTALNGFTSLVNLSSNSTACTLVPTGLTGSGSSTLSCTFSAAGSFHVTVTGASGSLSHSATITYTIQDFTINGSPASVTVNVGIAGTSTITITGLNGFAGVVSITTNSTSCTVSPTSLTGSGSATLSCTFASASTIHVAFNGTSGSLSHSATVTYTVQDFTLTASPTSVTVLAGSAGTSSITITSLNAFTGLVNLATNSTSCTANPTSVTGSGNSTLSCTFASAGKVDVNVTGTSSGLSHSADAMYIVQDFALAVSPANITVYPDTVANSTIQITSLNGFAGVVALATNSTASCAITPTSITGSGNATISCSFTGLNYSVIITGTNSTLSRTAMITVQTGTGSVGGVTLSINRLTLLLQILPALFLTVTFATAGVIAVRAHLRGRRNQNTERHKTDHLAPLEISL